MAASSSDYFMKVGRATATTMSAPGYTVGNTTINVASTTNYPTDTGVIIAVDEVDSSGERIAGTYNVFRAVVASATQLSSVVYIGGDANRNYAAGATTRVYIVVSSYQMNRLIDGLLVSHNQDGTLKDNLTLTTPILKNPAINDANNNEQIKFVTTTSAVNEFTVTNAATGNAPSISATGGDSNINVKFQPKGTGRVQGAVGNIDTWEEIGRATLNTTATTISIPTITAKKYLKFVTQGSATGGTFSLGLRFNNDSGSNYASLVAYNNGGIANYTALSSQTALQISTSFVSGGAFIIEGTLSNIQTLNKISSCLSPGEVGATNAANSPALEMYSGKWANSSTQITRVDVVKVAGTGSLAAGSELIILGHD